MRTGFFRGGLMKRNISLSLLIMLTGCFPLSSSEAKIQEIRERYNAIAIGIEHEGLLHHEIAFKTMVPGIGLQFTTIRFFYEFLQEGETGEILRSPLIKMTLDYMIAASVSIYIEYFFNEAEEVIFYYLRAEGYECGEKRFYFDNEKLIKVKTNSLGEECIESNAGYVFEDYESTQDFSIEDYAKAKEIVKKAQKYVKFFDEMQRIEKLDK
jgi:hypothetical protein